MTKTFSSKTLQAILIATWLSLHSLDAVATEVSIEIREDAPSTYTVKKGDTLWDVSNLFLRQAWLWPELWRNNTQIENPHLIYPGDILRLRFDNGRPVLDVVRDKPSVLLSPESRVRVKPEPIEILSWQLIAPYVSGGYIMTEEYFDELPMVLGDRTLTPRFTADEFVLSDASSHDEFEVVRKARKLYNSEGNPLGVHVDVVSEARRVVSPENSSDIIHITKANLEVKAGDRLLQASTWAGQDLRLTAAVKQQGTIVENVNGNALAGQKDMVIIDLGKSVVQPGTVFGIYAQGEDINRSKFDNASTAQRLLSWVGFSDTKEQPAYKVGELIVIKTFEHASYALVTKTNSHLKGGEIISSP